MFGSPDFKCFILPFYHSVHLFSDLELSFASSAKYLVVAFKMKLYMLSAKFGGLCEVLLSVGWEFGVYYVWCSS